MKILSIGNSFSVDCQRYVRDIALSEGEDIRLGDLYIGGCSLERHCENLQSGQPCYEYYENNVSLGRASLLTGVNDDDWDVITLQQASHFSGVEETYFPYVETLAAFVRERHPRAKLFINETWAYEYDSTHPQFVTYHSDRFDMHERLSAAYRKAAKSVSADIIPVGDAVAKAREIPAFDPEKGGIALTRDGFHLSYDYGRYLAAAVWFETLFGRVPGENSFAPAEREYTGKNDSGKPQYRNIPGTEADPNLIRILRSVAHEAVSSLG